MVNNEIHHLHGNEIHQLNISETHKINKNEPHHLYENKFMQLDKIDFTNWIQRKVINWRTIDGKEIHRFNET